jgi:membrane protein DedA with SNARE-associated domain
VHQAPFHIRPTPGVLASGRSPSHTCYPIPNPVLYLSCGTAGIPLLVFVIGDVIGALLWSGLLIGLSWGLGKDAVDVVDQSDHYELRLTVAVVIGLVVLSIVRRRRATAAGRS